MKTIAERFEFSGSFVNFDSDLESLWLLQQKLCRQRLEKTEEFDL